MLKPEQLQNKAPRLGVPRTLTLDADAAPDPAPPRPAGPPQRCVLCGGPCHAVPVCGESYEVQDCPDCGRSRRDPALARKAFA